MLKHRRRDVFSYGTSVIHQSNEQTEVWRYPDPGHTNRWRLFESGLMVVQSGGSPQKNRITLVPSGPSAEQAVRGSFKVLGAPF